MTRSWLPIPVEVEPRHCPVCGESDSSLLLKYDSFGFPIRTVECARCGLLYANPRPTQRFLADFYSNTYRQLYEGRKLVIGEYIRKNRLPQLAEMRLQRYLGLLGPGMRVMDVGCGLGLFLDAVRHQCEGAHVQGVEPEPNSADYCESHMGIGVDRRFLEQIPAARPFDVLSAFHVLEHVYDFESFFAAVRRHLRPGGLLLVETPNALGSWDGIGMFHIAHLQTFSIRTLSNLLRASGYEIVEAGEIEEAIDPSNLFVVARLTGRPPQLIAGRDPDEADRIRRRLARIRSARPARIVRTWAKLALCALRQSSF